MEHLGSRSPLLSVLGQRPLALDHILRPDALQFLARLEQRFRNTRRELLEQRSQRQASLDGGSLPQFLSETKEVREGSWKIAPCPKDLQDRKVEITAPVDRKMVINALNSGANVFMADFEDSHSPHWLATIEGQANLFDAVRKTIEYVSPEGKRYQLKTGTATLMVRPRGWHLDEKHVRLDGMPLAASLFDFGLFIYHNTQELIQRGSGPYFYLPKLESHLEARLWNDVFVFAQKDLGIPVGTIKATVLIETILAAFEMHEILFELRDHSAGLNCGRWDYIFSFIKKLRNHHDRALPNRHQITMGSRFLKSYSELLIQTCHRRGAHAIGGMAAQIPIRNDASANASAMEKVRADKLREVRAGHDGTWVAHPDLVSVAREVFDAHIQGPNQLTVERNDVQITPADLLAIPQGTITAEGLQNNISVGVQYLAAWLRGNGCVPLYNLMEDAATAEIARAQVWQWIRRQATLEDGRQVDATLFRKMLAAELESLREGVKNTGQPPQQLDLAAEIFDSISTCAAFCEFLTVPAYDHIIEKGAQ